ncbi:hypothetical protein CRG98_033499 [Punica granatum]|uniref:Uncharacterized protein n=1 Tax=Punica granatum TaxID=22663 RepID=A0A2I0IQ25_PUNGR|nr:hypothetical protein CRG98_033499 [Punica granatum]
MARASDTLSIIFTIIILVSTLFHCDIINGRAKLLTSEPNNYKPGLKETAWLVAKSDQAVPKSTSPGHSPWILGAKIPSPLTPGYSPETGDSTGLNDPNPDHP